MLLFGAPVGVANASFSFAFSLTIEIIKKPYNATQNKKKKHNKIVFLVRIESNSIEMVISKAPIDFEITKVIPPLLMKKGSIENVNEILE